MFLTNYPGSESEYRHLHYWVTKNLGRPGKCDHCGSVTAKKYEWANKSKEYKQDLSDWLRLCTRCHNKHDFGETCKRGHLKILDNQYVQPSNGYRRCKPCRKIEAAIYREKKRKEKQ